MIANLKKFACRNAAARAVLIEIVKIYCGYKGVRLKFSGNTLNLHRSNQTIFLDAKAWVHAPYVAMNFEACFSAVEPNEIAGGGEC